MMPCLRQTLPTASPHYHSAKTNSNPVEAKVVCFLKIQRLRHALRRLLQSFLSNQQPISITTPKDKTDTGAMRKRYQHIPTTQNALQRYRRPPHKPISRFCRSCGPAHPANVTAQTVVPESNTKLLYRLPLMKEKILVMQLIAVRSKPSRSKKRVVQLKV